jgi:hypothetical protein
VSARPARVAVLATLLAVACALSGCAVVPVMGLATGIVAARADAGNGPRERPCPDESDFDCVTIPVAADHFAPGSPTWGVTFAVHRGDVDSRGVLLTATGGPGSSGISVADQYMASMSTDITDHYDLVFIDQRGVGLSHPFRCDDTFAHDDQPSLHATSGAAARDHFAAAARRFVADCFAEAGVDPAATPPARPPRTWRRFGAGWASTGSTSTARATAPNWCRPTPPPTPTTSACCCSTVSST